MDSDSARRSVLPSETDGVGRVMASNVAIEARGLSKTYGRHRAVSDVTFRVEPGEIVGFLGPNGAGKTTTLRMLLGLARPTQGQAFLLGEPSPPPRSVAVRVGVLFEEPGFYPWMSGRRNLEVLLGDLADHADIDGALTAAGIEAASGRKVKAYSRGMRQRLALALALCGAPDVLILDEPGDGLDPAGTREIRSVLRSQADRGCAILLSSHQLSEVERACDRVIILSGGKVIASGTTKELGGDEAWISVEVPPDQEGVALRVLSRYEARREGPGRILVRGDSGRVVAETLAAAGIFPESILPRASTLEEHFLQLTERTAGVDEERDRS